MSGNKPCQGAGVKEHRDDFKELFYTLKLPEKLIDTKNIENMCNSYVELFIKEERKRLCV